ncbi:Alpha/Beta hydrolase protein [Podospora aff. communis PSN243]|uniref:Alpha/Beta hydrolase protein n=1 Tax=Podospora aff. communis PSN243 TaxID=3040156 RepID=A0AAV9GNH6_9PEZI|nr:Alpha/Beta hydrolase protein [Podospora aff. communis PSN243]
MPPSKPIIVIIPGAFHRPTHYDDVITSLRALDFTVLSIPLAVCGDADIFPLSTPADDVAALHTQLLPLLDAGHTAILVSHSYGSNVATLSLQSQSAPARARRNLPGGITGLISIAGFAFPERGKNLVGGDGDLPLRVNRLLKDGLVSVTEGAIGEFYSDVEPEKADKAFSGLCKYQSWRSMNTPPQFVEREIEVPKMYVVCERDKTVLPNVQESMVKTGEFERVVRLESGHSPFLSMPQRVVEVILGFVGEIEGAIKRNSSTVGDRPLG